MLPYDTLDNPRQYLTKTYLGERTAGYQAALGCRFRCTFCGVATMYRGKMALPAAARLEQDLGFLQQRLGVDAIQFYDHNFFDREVDMVPLLEVMAKFEMPWWCFARSDALANLSERSWMLVKKSRLRMAYIGAESPSDWLLHDIRKGTRSDQTLAAIEQCRSHGVIPELSFMLAPPQDPEGETERTFEFIRQIKRVHPATEVMIYIYTPLPMRRDNTNAAVARMAGTLRDRAGRAGRVPAQRRRMGGAALARLLVSQRCALALGAPAAADRRFHHRFGLSVSDHHGRPRPARGASPRCGGLPPGAIAFSATTTPGSCASRESSSASGTRAR